MKSILIIGLGRFGSHICMILHDMGHEILVVDTSEERVQKMLPYATNGLVADSTDKSFLESLGIPNFDICLVTIGDDFQSSMETAALLKDLGAKLVVSRASRGIHEKLLRRCGADVTVYPEKQTAFLTALRYGSDSLFEYFIISKDYAVCEVAIPQAWIGKTVGDLNIRKTTISISWPSRKAKSLRLKSRRRRSLRKITRFSSWVKRKHSNNSIELSI